MPALGTSTMAIKVCKIMFLKEQYVVERSDRWLIRCCRPAATAKTPTKGAGEQSDVDGGQSQTEESDRRWRGAIAVGGERLQVKENNRRGRGAIAGGGERSQVEGSDHR
jgi:hypothetical protein